MPTDNFEKMSAEKKATAQGPVVDFLLHTLGWKAFQQLCGSIGTSVLGQELQVFADTGDGGRDGGFYGQWRAASNDSRQGSFTLQAKHTSKPNHVLKLSDVHEELDKASRLAKTGFCDHYFLLSNSILTGKNDEEISAAFESIEGLKTCTIFGKERICQIIRDSPQLRMLVPRVYGLGDLSQILDQRAYSQAQDILSSLGDDLKKFVITDAYQRSAKALVENGFVLLLGEPACGKSSIAAALALGANDQWGCSTIKIITPDDFVTHSNPHEKQFFWIDDAFGATQLDWQSTMGWNRIFPYVSSAINRGAKVIFTSRDYIHKTALNFLKQSAFPLLQSSKVTIRVEKITIEEREQILYNHIKLGNQDQLYKSSVKPHLKSVIEHQRFTPEIARRLGHREFTKNLKPDLISLADFVERPMELLKEVIQTLDRSSRASIALVFMRNGALQSPIVMTEEELNAVRSMGGEPGTVREALNSLNESLVIRTREDGSEYWKFKHPTIRDAFASLVSEDTELMDIYLSGTPVRKMFSEISCGDVDIAGVKVIVPVDRYAIILNRIQPLFRDPAQHKSALYLFLANRCSSRFLQMVIERAPDLAESLHVYSYLSAITEIDLAVRLKQCGLLKEETRRRIVDQIKALAVETPDSDFLRDDIRQIFSGSEREDVLDEVRRLLLPNLEKTVSDWRSDYAGDDPATHFEFLKEAVNNYREAFSGEPESLIYLARALELIDHAIAELEAEQPLEPEYDRGEYRSAASAELGVEGGRSIFDDVDQ